MPTELKVPWKVILYSKREIREKKCPTEKANAYVWGSFFVFINKKHCLSDQLLLSLLLVVVVVSYWTTFHERKCLIFILINTSLGVWSLRGNPIQRIVNFHIYILLYISWRRAEDTACVYITNTHNSMNFQWKVLKCGWDFHRIQVLNSTERSNLAPESKSISSLWKTQNKQREGRNSLSLRAKLQL